jgi:hypothetical protein
VRPGSEDLGALRRLPGAPVGAPASGRRPPLQSCALPARRLPAGARRRPGLRTPAALFRHLARGPALPAALTPRLPSRGCARRLPRRHQAPGASRHPSSARPAQPGQRSGGSLPRAPSGTGCLRPALLPVPSGALLHARSYALLHARSRAPLRGTDPRGWAHRRPPPAAARRSSRGCARGFPQPSPPQGGTERSGKPLAACAGAQSTREPAADATGPGGACPPGGAGMPVHPRAAGARVECRDGPQRGLPDAMVPPGLLCGAARRRRRGASPWLPTPHPDAGWRAARASRASG